MDSEKKDVVDPAAHALRAYISASRIDPAKITPSERPYLAGYLITDQCESAREAVRHASDMQREKNR